MRAAGGIPGVELAQLGGSPVEITRAGVNDWALPLPGADVRVQLDICGAWVTTTGARDVHPIVVRRAGWVDLRGQPAVDRVGLGPGDAFVVPLGRRDPGDADRLLDDLLGCAEADVDKLAGSAMPALVLRVPLFTDGLQRVTEATGLPADAFAVPLHPVGSPDAEAWAQRPAPPKEARLATNGCPASVGQGRALLRRLLASWRMPELLDGDVELLASEVMTNSLLHADGPTKVVIRYDGEHVRVEVHDRSPELPVLEGPDLYSEHGRGIFLVDRLAERWGSEPTPQGKRVWFEVAA